MTVLHPYLVHKLHTDWYSTQKLKMGKQTYFKMWSQSHFDKVPLWWTLLNYNTVQSRALVLLFRKLDFSFSKVSNSNMSNIFLGIKLFYLRRQRDSEDSDLTKVRCVCQVTFFQLIRKIFIFWTPMLLIESNSISNMGCH